MMKKLIFIILSLLLVFSGCDQLEQLFTDRRAEMIEDAYKFRNNYQYVEAVEGFLTLNVDVVNYSTKNFRKDNINLFYVNNPYVPYLEFENYINLMSRMYEDYVYFFYEDNVWTVSAIYEDGERYDIVFDFNENAITLDSVSLIDALFTSDESSQAIIDVIDSLYGDSTTTVVQDESPFTIFLSDYNLEMVVRGDNHLVPMHVLQFFLSGYDNDMYYNGETVYYGDLFVSTSMSGDLINSAKAIEYDQELIAYDNNFNLMVYENFYGLMDIRESYVDDLRATASSDNYTNAFSDYIVDLEDSHTSVYMYMYGRDYSTYEGAYTEKEMANFDQDEIKREVAGCTTMNDAVTTKELSSNTVLVNVPTFMEEDFSDDYFEVIDSVRDYENIVLDIKCNTGGYLGNAPILLYPFTDEAIDINFRDTNESIVTSTYEKSDDIEIDLVSDANVYLVTSNVTFSAANLAASLFETYGIGEIIGSKSGGGTAAIAIVSSPSGAIMSMSFGSSIIVDNDYELIEDGIEVDYEINLNTNYEANILEVVE